MRHNITKFINCFLMIVQKRKNSEGVRLAGGKRRNITVISDVLTVMASEQKPPGATDVD